MNAQDCTLQSAYRSTIHDSGSDEVFAEHRRIYWGWIRERRKLESYKASGWAGIMSLLRVLTLIPDNRLEMEPAPELQRLRGKSMRLRSLPEAPGQSALLERISGDCIELVAEFDPGDAERVGLRLRCAPDGSEQTLMAYNRVARTLFSDTIRASQDAETVHTVQEGRFELVTNH
jgi:beta-fructofuranosidase